MENSKKTSLRKEVIATGIMFFASVLSAFTLHIFVYPADFAPSGVDGIATMLQKLTGLSAGIFFIVINFPLLLVALFVLKKRYVIYTVLYTVISSILLVVLREINFYQFVTETDKLIPAIFSGLLLGVRTGIMLKIGASTAGVETIAGMIQKKYVYVNIERIVAICCYVTIGVSYFVYWNLNSVLLAIVQTFVLEKAAAVILKDMRNAVEFKIITKDPEKVKDDIIKKLRHGATVVRSKGAFTEEENNIVITVVNNRQVPEFLDFIKRYPDTFVYYSDVTGIRGNFRWGKDDEVK